MEVSHEGMTEVQARRFVRKLIPFIRALTAYEELSDRHNSEAFHEAERGLIEALTGQPITADPSRY